MHSNFGIITKKDQKRMCSKGEKRQIHGRPGLEAERLNYTKKTGLIHPVVELPPVVMATVYVHNKDASGHDGYGSDDERVLKRCPKRVEEVPLGK